MKTLAEQVKFYGDYHKNPYNRLTHYFGIPIIIFSILLLLSWIRLPDTPFWLNGALVFIVLVSIYYFLLDWRVSILMATLVAPIFFLASYVGSGTWKLNITLFLVLFLGGWTLQIIGHSVFEKRKPAFTDNLVQLLIGPIFFVLEILEKFNVKWVGK
ncbi:MAG: DUF962 domain-containing protein [Candidatus Hydrogenedentes bacterium]|nr:DUF962 domain-containing protein [Candidatus Hydrogenedentota bacterium]